MTLNVDVSIDKIDNLGPKVQSGITKYLKKGADRGVAEASDKVPVDRGAGGGLLGQIFSPVEENGTIRWGVRDAPHARPIEFGTQPFYPPIEPLIEWSERVSGDKGLGFYVARHKIPEEGIDAQPYMRPGREVQVRWYNSHDADEWIDKELR